MHFSSLIHEKRGGIGQLDGTGGAREITRFDLMAYLDPASNPRSKPQVVWLQTAKVPLQISFKHSEPFCGISCKYMTKNYLHEITLFVCFEGESHAREITKPFRTARRRINDLR